MEKNNINLMTNAPVPKAILTLSVPTVLSTIVSLVYNLTDTYFIGLLDDPVQLGAVSLAFPVFMVIQAVGNILEMALHLIFHAALVQEKKMKQEEQVLFQCMYLLGLH